MINLDSNFHLHGDQTQVHINLINYFGCVENRALEYINSIVELTSL